MIRTTLYTVSVLTGIALVLLDHFLWGFFLVNMSGLILVTKKQLGVTKKQSGSKRPGNPLLPVWMSGTSVTLQGIYGASIFFVILGLTIGLTLWLAHLWLIPKYVFTSIFVLPSIWSVAGEWRKLRMAAQPTDAVSAAPEVGNVNNSGRDPKRT